MRRIGFAVAFILASLPFAAIAQAPAPSSTPVAAQNFLVAGTFDKSSIVLAYYRSPLWAAILADRRFELNRVKAANVRPEPRNWKSMAGRARISPCNSWPEKLPSTTSWVPWRRFCRLLAVAPPPVVSVSRTLDGQLLKTAHSEAEKVMARPQDTPRIEYDFVFPIERV
jgi:hypothetical protein